MTVLRADVNALLAVDAELFVESNLGMEANRLRIVAPQAVERASLEEYSRSYARSVLNGEVLYVENESL
jgi:hypothetical protein